MPPRCALVDRFWTKVAKGDGCWLWTRAKSHDGYGIIRADRRGPNQYAHRVAYELCVGPIPDGLKVLHSCDVPACVNPAHLFVGTTKDNADDCVAKGRHGFGHQVGERHGMAILTEVQVREIRASPLGNRSLAKKYGLASKTSIANIRSGKLWKHVREEP